MLRTSNCGTLSNVKYRTGHCLTGSTYPMSRNLLVNNRSDKYSGNLSPLALSMRGHNDNW